MTKSWTPKRCWPLASNWQDSKALASDEAMAAGRAAPLPPRQQLVAAGKWPLVGEHEPSEVPAQWPLQVAGLVAHPRTLVLDELRQLPQVTRQVDIHCVTRWSKLGATFSGVRLADLLALTGPRPEAKFVAFVARTARSHSTSLELATALNLDAFLALAVDGQPLPVEHGGPVRLVTPGRYFYKSLKWLARVELLAEDRLGYWEATAGYHNHADPWREERYRASTLTSDQMQTALDQRDFRGQDLRGLQAAGQTLDGLQADGALLRDADFSNASLRQASFRGANLTNARFCGAQLGGACFSAADLEGADFSGADLRGADLREASLLATTFLANGVDGAPLAAQMDQGTQISAARLEDLMPDQAAFVRQAGCSV